MHKSEKVVSAHKQRRENKSQKSEKVIARFADGVGWSAVRVFTVLSMLSAPSSGHGVSLERSSGRFLLLFRVATHGVDVAEFEARMGRALGSCPSNPVRVDVSWTRYQVAWL